MSGGGYVNLNDVGSLTRSGKGYAGTADTTFGSAKAHQSNMEGVQGSFKGMAGSTFQGVAAMSTGNTAQLAKQIADQAARAVLGEKDAVMGDEDAHENQQSGKSANEGFMSVAAKPINF
ncbi:MAG: hypothetical protein ACRDO7_18460 [Nocardioidaceae bacterium]